MKYQKQNGLESAITDQAQAPKAEHSANDTNLRVIPCGLSFMLVMHEDLCPYLNAQRNCNCCPVIDIVDQATYEKTVGGEK
jgi:hypothetical protein